MNRCIRRRYVFSYREIHELLLDWMKAKDLPRPQYVGDTNDTKWSFDDDGLSVEWTDEDQIDVPSGTPTP